MTTRSRRARRPISTVVVKEHLDLLNRMFHKFNTTAYFKGKPLEQLQCLNMAAEFAMITDKQEKRFMLPLAS